MHLCDRYNIDINSLDGVDMSGGTATPVATAPTDATQGAESTGVAEEGGSVPVEGAEEEVAEGGEEGAEVPKKKSPVMKIIIIIIVLAGLGVGGYFGYEYYMGMTGADTEEVLDEAAAEETEPVSEPEPEPEPEMADTTEVSDSTGTDNAAADSDTEADAGGEGSH